MWLGPCLQYSTNLCLILVLQLFIGGPAGCQTLLDPEVYKLVWYVLCTVSAGNIVLLQTNVHCSMSYFKVLQIGQCVNKISFVLLFSKT